MEEILITALNHEFHGLGVAPNGRKVSYPYTLPGDTIQVSFFKKRSRKARYLWEGWKEKVERPEGLCTHFGACGGCLGQHIDYSLQCDLKFAPIQKLFSDGFGFTFQTMPAEQSFGYRGRMDFSVFPGPTIGLRARGNFRRVVDVGTCLIQADNANALLSECRNLLSQYPEIPWDRRSESGGLKYITIRTSQSETDRMVIFTFTEGFDRQEIYQSFVSSTKEALSCEHIVFCFNRMKSEVSAQGESNVVRGNSYFKETILDKEFKIPFDSFFQPNPKGFLPILEFLEASLPKESEALLDLFSGSGFFSHLFGERFERIHCWELSPSSIAMAKETLLARFPEKQIYAEVKNLFQEERTEPREENAVLLLDPPRAGAGAKVMYWIKDFGPRDVFYISCNPYSQGEDLKSLKEVYQLKGGLLVDPYPHTPHCESVIHLQRKI
ncbi:tRNA (Uracil-5-)-methyltransferase domain protein [Leptospira ryugenii]|uniref:tRNA (Uracil-5-)-methyltransferase domain protein n=1 Tax=Leptospira ryugenii TaxID=1917863 RepID=A0A2P2DZ21_9LEPT|nr:class I SAM-dependent RNA methyltransferase [Leptospira ryugenii]GBF49863.1 tRNA (Uracil-5-)-methyltransferase domain protein [Leptospira ryugenii]